MIPVTVSCTLSSPKAGGASDAEDTTCCCIERSLGFFLLGLRRRGGCKSGMQPLVQGGRRRAKPTRCRCPIEQRRYFPSESDVVRSRGPARAALPGDRDW